MMIESLIFKKGLIWTICNSKNPLGNKRQIKLLDGPNHLASLGADDHNWGLKRCIDGVQTANWGSDGTTTLSGIVSTTSGGRNVDVLIVDGFIDPTHPEFAYNSDGTGGTRVRQSNCHLHHKLQCGYK